MKTLSQVITSERQKRKLSLEQLRARTQIPIDVLKALESSSFETLPPPTLVLGALDLLAEEFDIEAETLHALYRRDGGNTPASSTQKSKRKNRSWKTRLRFHLLSPRGLSWAVSGLVITLAIAGIGWQWWSLSQPPELTVAEPLDNGVLQNPVRISGRTNPENTLTVNTEVLSLDQTGNFATSLTLPTGQRTLVIEATDQRGRINQVVRFIQVE